MSSQFGKISIHLDPDELTFSVFSAEEIRKLSVASIVSPFTFNVLGNALPGGLYDPALGPSHERADPCTSCNQTYLRCTGHIGHIELCMLTYNPFFIQNVTKLLRISCLHCFKIQLTDHVKYVFELQLRLIDAGYVAEAYDIEIYKSHTSVSSEVKVKTESGISVDPKLAQLEEMLLNKPKQNINTKNIESARNGMVNSTLRNFVTKKCIHCHLIMKNVRLSYEKLVMSFTKVDMSLFYKSKNDLNNPDKIKSTNKSILADECREYFRKLCTINGDFIVNVFPILKLSPKSLQYATDIFFTDVIPVTPPLARPANILKDRILEHRQTTNYKDIITANSVLRAVIQNIKSGETNFKGTKVVSKYNVINSLNGDTMHEKMFYAWQDLQDKINRTLNAPALNAGTGPGYGLKQIIEKKEGLIRMHMMGKRVNFAARTVITPDPNMNVDEIGVPEKFAMRLTYPVPVTPWNLQELRNMVLNGPDVHPGALIIEDNKGAKTKISSSDETIRESLAKTLLSGPDKGIKIVHRHLLSGDVLLLNRQPTLHRPGIQAHKARILKGEKTFRLHYSNCKAYNADFDGDEMNAHFPQNELGRSEAYNLANVANNYIVPKDGTPLGGLIQDHMIAGVGLSLRGRFFNKQDYQQLVYQGLSNIKGDIQLLPPSILKPLSLWSGKQVLSTIIKNVIPTKQTAINICSTAKINAKAWEKEKPRKWLGGGTILKNNNMTEAEVIIRGGELLVGILDKTHYGSTPYGLVHCMYELYGGDCSIQILTSLAKVFTLFLQWEGFTLGVHDILVNNDANELREHVINESRQIGYALTASALDLPEDTPNDILSEKLEEAYSKNPNFRKILDRTYKSSLDGYTNQINKICLPAGLICKFPENNLQLMVQSGAKGSTVNTMQISSLLGQIELEGKRPSLMISGKSLPSFASFETSPKSGGFIDGRFMTGIQPQDFFFHCMAGREGLIDTAVKTSRSGYLQRCLIKHLEGLNVNYDMTVRDSDKSVIQFMYGEDGLDISRSQFLKTNQLEFLHENYDAIVNKTILKKLKNNDEQIDELEHKIQKLRKWIKKHGKPLEKKSTTGFQEFSKTYKNKIDGEDLEITNKLTGHRKIDQEIVSLWRSDELDKKEKFNLKYTKCPDPITTSCSPNNYFGAITEYLDNLIETYAKNNPEKKQKISEIMYVKSIKSLAPPGEPVGLLAAQSVGEPSTQMTLNTFHFAGRGEMNVTLGIPRLREILMMASANIKTPSMDIPFKESNKIQQISDKLRLKLIRVVVADVLESINIKSQLKLSPNRNMEYILRFNFLPRKCYQKDFCVKPSKILKHMNKNFFKMMFQLIVKSAKEKKSIVDISDKEKKKDVKAKEDQENKKIDNEEVEPTNKKTKKLVADDSSDDEHENDCDDDDATNNKLKKRRADENDYEEPDNDEELNDANEDENMFMSDEEDDNIAPNQKSSINIASEQSEVVRENEYAESYTFDDKHYLWCEIKFNLPIKFKNIDMTTILRTVAAKSVISEVSNIKRAFVYEQNKEHLLKTDGINFTEMCKYENILDLNRLYSNDIIRMAQTYGIEAAGRVIVKEVQNVFKVYGITVDPRHLLLISDYMTFNGTVQALNRQGMSASASPLQQMSFESALTFMKNATIAGVQDPLESPSSRLILGLPCKAGTGSFTLLNDHSLFLKKLSKT